MSRKYLSVPTLKKVQETLVLVSHYEQMLGVLRQSVVKAVQDEAGVDISAGQWKLDIQTGVLEEEETHE